MPISLPNWAQHETQDYNGYGNLLENALKGYEMARKPKQIAQEEQQRELANILLGHQGTNEGIKSRYLPQEYEANIANTQAHTGLYGAQTRGLDISNAIEQAYGAKKAQASLDFSKAQTGALNTLTPLQAQELREIIQGRKNTNRGTAVDAQLSEMVMNLLNNSGNRSQTAGATNYDDNVPYPARVMGQQGAPAQQLSQTSGNNSATPVTEMDSIWLNNPLLRGKLEAMGVKGKVESKYDPKTGELIEVTTLPSGKISTKKQQIGKTITEKERESGFAKSDVEAAKEANDSAKNYLAVVDPAKKVLAALNKNEKLSKEITGPGKYQLAKYMGKKDAQELIGNIEEAHGVLVTAQAGQFKGAFRAGEQHLVERMKGSLNDPFNVLKAKTEAIIDSSNRLAQRNRIIAQNIRSGMSQEAAIDDAVSKTKFDDIEKKLDDAEKDLKEFEIVG
jgi:hypothetical protein